MKAGNRNKTHFFFLICLLCSFFAKAQNKDLPLKNTGAGFHLHTLLSGSKQADTPATSPGFQTAFRFQPVLLPEWTAEALPFFCRIEHQWSKNKSTGFKFRLGSVDYVDWLEGKSHFATFAP